jgi:hypothetical protein
VFALQESLEKIDCFTHAGHVRASGKTTPAGLEPAKRRACPATHPMFDQRSEHVRHRKRAQIEKEIEKSRKTSTRSVFTKKKPEAENFNVGKRAREITENRRSVAPRGVDESKVAQGYASLHEKLGDCADKGDRKLFFDMLKENSRVLEPRVPPIVASRARMSQ